MFNIFSFPYIRQFVYSWKYNPLHILTRQVPIADIVSKEAGLRPRGQSVRKSMLDRYKGLDSLSFNGEIPVGLIGYIISFIIAGDTSLRSVALNSSGPSVPHIFREAMKHIRIGTFNRVGTVQKIVLDQAYFKTLDEYRLRGTVLDVDYLRSGGLTEALSFLTELSVVQFGRESYVKVVESKYHNLHAGETLKTTGMSLIENSKYIVWHSNSAVGNLPGGFELLNVYCVSGKLESLGSQPDIAIAGSSYVVCENTPTDAMYSLIEYICFGEDDSSVQVNVSESNSSTKGVRSSKAERGRAKFTLIVDGNPTAQQALLGLDKIASAIYRNYGFST